MNSSFKISPRAYISTRRSTSRPRCFCSGAAYMKLLSVAGGRPDFLLGCPPSSFAYFARMKGGRHARHRLLLPCLRQELNSAPGDILRIDILLEQPIRLPASDEVDGLVEKISESCSVTRRATTSKLNKSVARRSGRCVSPCNRVFAEVLDDLGMYNLHASAAHFVRLPSRCAWDQQEIHTLTRAMRRETLVRQWRKIPSEKRPLCPSPAIP